MPMAILLYKRDILTVCWQLAVCIRMYAIICTYVFIHQNHHAAHMYMCVCMIHIYLRTYGKYMHAIIGHRILSMCPFKHMGNKHDVLQNAFLTKHGCTSVLDVYFSFASSVLV